jgi:hypothetical protein
VHKNGQGAGCVSTVPAHPKTVIARETVTDPSNDTIRPQGSGNHKPIGKVAQRSFASSETSKPL